MSCNLAVPSRALAIGAHPDDIEFGCGGTLAKWAASGCEIHHLVCTDGSKGSWDPGQDLAELVAVRHAEQRAAARVLGGQSEVTFLDWPDGELESGLRQRWQVAAAIRRLKPEVVLGHDPWKRYRLHPDHRHAGQLAVEAIVAARDPHFFPETDAAPHRPEALLLFEADEPDHVEEVTGSIECQLAALLEHRSQLRSTMGIEEDGPDRATQLARFDQRLRTRARDIGERAGVGFGEEFKLIDRC